MKPNERDEQMIRLSVESSSTGIYWIQQDGRIVYANRAAVHILGYSTEELKEMSVLDIDPTHTRESWRARWEELKALGAHSFERMHLHSDGRLVPVALTVNFIVYDDGEYLIAFVNDITERHEILDALRASERRYRTMIDQSPLSTVVYRPDGSIMDSNPAFCALWNISAEVYEFLASHYSVLEDEQLESLGITTELLLAFAGETVEIDDHFYDPEKTEATRAAGLKSHWVRARAYPVKDDEGSVIQVVVIHEDVSLEHAAEAILRESEARLAMALYGARLGLWDWKVKTGEAAFNAQWAEMLGYQLDEIEPRATSWSNLIHPGDLERVLRTVREHHEGKTEFYQSQFRMRAKSGVWHWVSSAGKVFERDPNGDPVRMIGVHADIDSQKRTEAERLRLEAAIEQAAEGVMITNQEGFIQYVNPAFVGLSGYGKEEAVGQTPRLLKSGKQDEKFYESLWGTIRAGEIWSGRLVNQRKDGKLYTVDCTISPMRDETGTICHYVAVEHDVTGTLALEGRYRQAQKMEAVGRLAGGVAHDFNNLLTPILGYSEDLLEELPGGDPRREAALEIQEAGMRARDLVRQLLAFGKKQPLKISPIDLNQVVLGFKKLLQRVLREDVRIETALHASGTTIRGDIRQIEQVIMNLAINAQDAMPEGGTLTVETADVVLDRDDTAGRQGVQPGRYVMLAVSDSGIGMDRQTRERIFEPFFTTKDEGGGTGLGLSMVYGIVEQHGGSIWTYSELGRGTQFKIYLPISSEEVAKKSDPAVRSDLPGGSETVLVAEDNPQVRKLTCAILTSLGYGVKTADSPEECLRIAALPETKIDLLLTDVVMPGMNGPELGKRLRTIQPKAAILFMSGYTDCVLSEHGVPGENVQFIPKPFTRQALAAAIRKVLE